jgi:hypothetical protein
MAQIVCGLGIEDLERVGENIEEVMGSTWDDSPASGLWRGGRNRGARWREVAGDSASRDGGGPVFLRRREAVEYVRLCVVVLLALSSSPEGAPSRRNDGSQCRRRRRSARLQHRRRGASRSDGRLGHEG